MVSDGQHVLLNGDTENYTGEQGYAVHTISKELNKGITVQLNQPYILNCIKMLLWDKDNRSYSYFIQVHTLVINGLLIVIVIVLYVPYCNVMLQFESLQLPRVLKSL